MLHRFVSRSPAETCEAASSDGHRRSFLHMRGMRPGAVVKSLMTTMCGAGMLVMAAAVLDPETLQAGAPRHSASLQNSAIHDEFVRAMQTILEQSKCVLAVNPGDKERGTELVVWLRDEHDFGVINMDELAVLRHSTLFRTVTLYTICRDPSSMREQASAQAEWRGVLVNARDQLTRSVEAELTRPLPMQAAVEHEMVDPGFIDRWRAMASVSATVLTTGLSDMQVEQWQRPHANSLSLLRLHLRWSGDQVDDPVERVTIINAGRSPRA